ncbi:MAG TPA: hypothetical protein VG273_02730 [Bryobacteraceae bacterium]|nr:hypothetical protein [Bryobacteraceae bacterium]
MRFSAALLFFACSSCFGQRSIEIRLPHEVDSRTLFVRYVLAGETLGGWLQPLAGVSSYSISTMRGSRPASGIKAILYAPGCAIQVFDMRLFPDQKNEQYTFACHPVGNVIIAGKVVPADLLRERGVKLQARYVARWAAAFLGLHDEVLTVIPMGSETPLAPDGGFHLSLPDLARDDEAGAAGHNGEIQIWAKDRVNDSLVAQLAPTGVAEMATRMGGLKIKPLYPAEIVFAPCIVGSHTTVRHTPEGFAIRGSSDPCQR